MATASAGRSEPAAPAKPEAKPESGEGSGAANAGAAKSTGKVSGGDTVRFVLFSAYPSLRAPRSTFRSPTTASSLLWWGTRRR